MFNRHLRYMMFAGFSLFVIAAGMAVGACGQTVTNFETGKLETRLKAEFKLTSIELGRLRPLISRENENVARTFGHFCDDRYRENFLSLWDGIRDNRWEFEGTLPANLNRREKSALRAARLEFESMITNVWSDDYVDLLTGALELDRLQLSGVQMVFVNESERRLALIARETKDGVRKNADWEKITDNRDASLKSILSSDQYRIYLSIGMQMDRSIA